MVSMPQVDKERLQPESDELIAKRTKREFQMVWSVASIDESLTSSCEEHVDKELSHADRFKMSGTSAIRARHKRRKKLWRRCQLKGRTLTIWHGETSSTGQSGVKYTR